MASLAHHDPIAARGALLRAVAAGWAAIALACAGCVDQGTSMPNGAQLGAGTALPGGGLVGPGGTAVKSVDADTSSGVDAAQSGDAAGGGDAGAADGAGSDAPADAGGASADASDDAATDAGPTADAGSATDAGPVEDADPIEDTATEPDEEDPPPPDLPLKDVKDTGEDPTKPWYANPLPDQYQYPDSPDAGADVPSDGGSFPPICTPQIGTVSVTETVGPGGKLDIVVWIDTSGSMSQEAAWTNQNMNKFTQYLESKKIDYRLVLYGTGLGLCIGPPLGTGLPACNSAEPQKFLTVKQSVASTNGLLLLSNAMNFAKYSQFLRPDAVHNVLGITDDNSSMAAGAFQTSYTALLKNQGLNEKFVYHAICSFINEANPSQAGNCNTGAKYGSQHVALAMATGGSLYQVCKTDWTATFDGLSKAIAATAKPVCTYNLPAPKNKKLNPANVKASHIENSVVVPLTKISGQGQCGGTPSGWFYDNDAAPSQVTLCEEQCKKLVGGAILFSFGCAL